MKTTRESCQRSAFNIGYGMEMQSRCTDEKQVTKILKTGHKLLPQGRFTQKAGVERHVGVYSRKSKRKIYACTFFLIKKKKKELTANRKGSVYLQSE